MTEGPIILTRPEQVALLPAITDIYSTVYGADFAVAVDSLRQAPNYDSKLSIMALYDGTVVGHILFVPLSETVTIAPPPAILPDHQGQMIGSALLYETLEVQRRAKQDAIILLDNPLRYQKFGFKPLAAQNISLDPSLDTPATAFRLTDNPIADLALPQALIDFLPPLQRREA